MLVLYGCREAMIAHEYRTGNLEGIFTLLISRMRVVYNDDSTQVFAPDIEP